MEKNRSWNRRLRGRRAVASLLAGSLTAPSAFATGQFEVHTTIDPVFGLPVPPVNFGGGGPALFSASAVATGTWLFSALFLIALLWGLRESIRAKSAIPICLALSGIPCVLAELNLDVMSAVVYANNDNSTIFSLMGRNMGWYVIAGWAGYGGLFSLVAYKTFSRHELPNKFMWVGLLLVCAGQTCLEEIIGRVNGIYYYYGNQPLAPFSQFPWWIILPTSGGVCLLAALAYRFNASLRGWKAVGLIVIAPFTFCGFMGFTSLPAWIAVNSKLPWLMTQSLGLMTVAAGFFAFGLVMKLILQRDPLQFDGTGQIFR